MADTSYIRVRRLEAGTFTPGEDWAAQFDSTDGVLVTAVPTANGEIVVPESSLASEVLLVMSDGGALSLLADILAELRAIRSELVMSRTGLPFD